MTDATDHDVRHHRSEQTVPDDFDEFWQATIDEARNRAWTPRLRVYDVGLAAVEVFDVEFSGYAGDPIRGWFRRPRYISGPLPIVVRFTGYGAGRGSAIEDLLWSVAGYAELVMDTRGQGDGGTADGARTGEGFLTRGIANRDDYFYRRVFTDAAMAIDAARRMPGVDPERVATIGNSQGGGIAIAAATLDREVRVVLAQSPFLADVPYALQAGAIGPWLELLALEKTHPRAQSWIAETTPYFDVVNFARRARARVSLSCGLVDEIVPAATTFAVHDAWPTDRSIRAWAGAGHESGGAADLACALDVLRHHLAPASSHLATSRA